MDVIDSHRLKYVRSIPGLPGVAGALVSNEGDLVFTSNRGEKTIGVFRHGHDRGLKKVSVGGYPNGLSFNHARGLLLAANVSRQDDPAPISASVVDVSTMSLKADIHVPGRTRWTVFDNETGRFYVNIAKPSQIVAIDANNPTSVVSAYEIPGMGPHGLDIDSQGRRLFCACDDGSLYTLDLENGTISGSVRLSGSPDVIFYNDRRGHLYVAVGDPGVIDIVDTDSMRLIETAKTELGAHTFAFDPESNMVFSFFPTSHRASVFQDG